MLRNIQVWQDLSVDVLYYDQWDFWSQMFRPDSNAWDMFNHQHGPHKMGLGYFFLYVVAQLSGWNLRTESLSLVLVSGVTAAVFLYLKYQMFRRWDWSDAVIPAMCLSFAHYEIYYIGTNPGLNVLPLLLIGLIAICIGMQDTVGKYLSLVVLGFLATYTGFAIFAGLLVPIYCLSQTVRFFLMKRDRGDWRMPVCSFTLSSLGFWSFFWDYRFNPAASDFVFPHTPYTDYGVFVSKYWAHFFNLGNSDFWIWIIGLCTILVIVWVVARSSLVRPDRLSKEEERRRDAIAFLCLFSLLYSVNVAVGRVSFGTEAGRVSRYLIFLVPLWIGAYFVILERRIWFRSVAVAGLFSVTMFSDWSFEKSRVPGLERLSANKEKWVRAYLDTGSILEANRISGFEVYPYEWAYDKQEGYIDFMEERGLGFTRDRVDR